jgi:hypothetical protein
MSANEAGELRAFQELESLVRHLGEELAAFRKRALVAEAQLKEVGQHAPARNSAADSSGGASAVEIENTALRTRIARSEDRVRQMLDRVRFLRQQLQSQGSGPGATAGIRSS